MKTATYFSKLPPDIQNSPDGQYLKRKYERYEATNVGKMAPDFTSSDTAYKKVSLSDFKGKYILLDFWANWCGYCRKESPFMNKAFKKYKSKNFTIISVSLDDKVAEGLWKKAIKDDHYCWTNLSDLKGWESPLIDAFGIVSIPKNLLIDPTGKILAKELRGKHLEEKLHEILDK
jgi:peroxiredoxin